MTGPRGTRSAPASHVPRRARLQLAGLRTSVGSLAPGSSPPSTSATAPGSGIASGSQRLPAWTTSRRAGLRSTSPGWRWSCSPSICSPGSSICSSASSRESSRRRCAIGCCTLPLASPAASAGSRSTSSRPGSGPATSQSRSRACTPCPVPAADARAQSRRPARRLDGTVGRMGGRPKTETAPTIQKIYNHARNHPGRQSRGRCSQPVWR